jgi:hypothetical protein
MKVTLKISGGFAPSVMGAEYAVDSTTLDETNRKALGELVDAAFAEPHRAPNPELRDARGYDIRVTTDAGERTLVAYDGSMPPATRRLIDMIKSVAKR